MAKGMVCPNRKCLGRRIWQKGFVPTRTGQKKRYVCFKCGKTFYAPSKASPKMSPKMSPKAAKSKKRSR